MRNPVTDPQRGDVLRKGKLTVRVAEVEDRHVHYEFEARGYPTQRIVTLRQWATVVDGYEVVKR